VKKLLLTGVALAALSAQPAMSADLARPVYRPAPVVPFFSWTGFYIGANVGGVWSTSETTFTANPAFFTSAALISADGSPSLKSTGLMGGAQAGYNWQTGAIVLGLEADINATKSHHSSSITRGAVPGLPLGFTVSEDIKSNWLFTLRPRVGVAFDRTMIYATGGLAVANFNFTQSSAFPDCPCGITGTASGTKTGWTVGGGAEFAFAPMWSVKVEYLYVDLGKRSFADNLGAFGFPDASFTHETHLRENIVRLGINYRFGYTPAPAVYRK
jgi:outer membrane immunogenic protein